jgi:hypothetical protein
METLVFDKWKKKAPVHDTPINGEVLNRSGDDVVPDELEVKLRSGLPELKIMHAATQFMEQKMERYLEYEYDKFRLPNYSLLDGVLSFESGDQKNRAFEELKKFHEERFSELARLKSCAHRKSKFVFPVEPGFEIIIPPYDCGWSNRFASITSVNKTSGSFKSAPAGNSFGGAGIGVFLQPTTNISVRFSAHCPISYSWSNFIGEGGGYAASTGGVGITIYNATTGTIVKDDQETLWNQSRRPYELELGAGSDDLYFQNMNIGHTYFEMKAGCTYLVWLWCWAFADSGPNAGAYALIECKVPFMIIDASTL